MTLKIITDPNPTLRKKADLIEHPLSAGIQALIPNLIKTMHNDKGIGIAAPQVGESIRLIVINIKDGPLVLINPKIVAKSIRKEVEEEGCLSVPGVFGMVKRYKKVKVAAVDQKGEKMTMAGEGLLARVLQHEIDHLNGILFTDKIIRKTTDKAHGEKVL
ncbi:MAG: peptide deformylase [Candidatus Kerfeldbacteria bacterium CG08_land_8_20_14_0_20_40_16]|uniref:Peptide deformylase n=1 Tax=Candidatus Kerfeldbacteria bacterium CG08_land_8_20_14_0_20_40_16 TaxID=2014244 RepID=A0A2H0YUE2_9BACT|nr:MAG: peptide deformylase [Candidatus Kerfeldbacteria bacterium CG08_land_8_20_14_0_20_40_16]